MTSLNAFQGDDWLAQRIGRITGSRVAAILGLDKYKSADDVMRDMVREYHGAESEFTGNEATAFGHDNEPHAISAYEDQTECLVISTGLHVHHEHPWLAASPDGLVGHDGLIEVKCPFRATYTTLAEVPHYAAQIQLQLACTMREWCDFVIWRDGEIIVERVEADPLWLFQHMPALEAFSTEYAATVASEEKSARHLIPLIREDLTWSALEAEYADAKAEADKAGARLEAAKKALIAEAGEQSQKGRLVHVIRSERSGGYDYAKAIDQFAPGADLAAFKKKPTVVYSVKECR
jgi:putative phage-type endonuclease